MPVRSPCINICDLDRQRVCKGCGRTVDEIGRWSLASEAERAAIVAELPARMAQRRRFWQRRT
jgi:predicted Fe-S protein YdhL (DUF1289 family)